MSIEVLGVACCSVLTVVTVGFLIAMAIADYRKKRDPHTP